MLIRKLLIAIANSHTKVSESREIAFLVFLDHRVTSSCIACGADRDSAVPVADEPSL